MALPMKIHPPHGGWEVTAPSFYEPPEQPALGGFVARSTLVIDPLDKGDRNCFGRHDVRVGWRVSPSSVNFWGRCGRDYIELLIKTLQSDGVSFTVEDHRLGAEEPMAASKQVSEHLVSRNVELAVITRVEFGYQHASPEPTLRLDVSGLNVSTSLGIGAKEACYLIMQEQIEDVLSLKGKTIKIMRDESGLWHYSGLFTP